MEDRSSGSGIEVRDICIEFPGVKALQDVSCAFRPGHVTALVGANGAGKSTLMKILAGTNPTYRGSVFVNGEEVKLDTPQIAKGKGIEIVYQEVDTALVHNLTVAENIMMEELVYGMRRKMFIDWKKLNESARSILESLDIHIDPKRLLSTLTLAEKQMVVIARAILGKSDFLILDEPTAPLSQSETEKLFELVRKLKKDGVGVIFISHRLNELFEICDSIIVLRDGKLIDSFPLETSVTVDSIVEKMLGTARDSEDFGRNRNVGEMMLETVGLSDLEGKVRNVDINVRSGEIVGVFGLVGAGKTELCKTIFGANKKSGGIVKVKDQRKNINAPYRAVDAGMAYIPEERRKEGVLVEETVAHNLSICILSDFSRNFSFINNKKEARNAEAMVSKLSIKTPTIRQRVSLLSGGNQQKVTVGKWLDSDADLYIFDEPTKGIDVGAKNEIYKLIDDLASKGKAVLYVSSEQSEILRLSDRIYIMYDGRIQQEFENNGVTEEQLLFYSVGGSKSEN